MDQTETPTVPPPLPDLSACERERIHMPGAIQPYGCLLFCTLPSWVVRAVSANAGQLLGREAEAMLDATLDTLLPEKTLHDLRNVLQASMVSGGAERLIDQPIDDGPDRYDLTVHMAASNAVVEIIPRKGADTLATDPITLVKSMVGRLKRAPTLERFLHLAAHQVRAVTGFDRVMVYKFLPDGTGEVRAEALRSGLTPFLGLRYPASDIPAQARALYRRQWLRLIPDVNYQPVPLLARSGAAAEADLSLAALRSVSPVHLEYLRNMDSHATLTISLMVGDALWGLIACHHSSPRRISSSTCAAAELFGQIFSLQIEAKEQARELMLTDELRKSHDRLMAAMSAEVSIFDDPARFRDLVVEMIPCDGYGVWSEKGFIAVGTTPPPEAMPDLVRHLGERDPQQPYATAALSRELASAGAYVADVSGVLSIPFSRRPREYLLFFRAEVVQTVTWGGDPTKPVIVEQGGARIGPRTSFDAWKETVRGQSVPWQPAELQIAETLRISLLDVILRRADIVNSERRAAQESQATLIAELNHRVKNILALIRSLVRQSRQNALTMEGFAGDLEHRIRALALAHDQLTQTGWHRAPLRRLLEAEARAWTHSPERVSLVGPGVTLDSRAYQALALVFHEMMTNAAKYGALSRSAGRLSVIWSREGGGDLRIEWRELGGPLVQPPERRGFGSVIVEQTIPFELRGEARVEYLTQGVHGSFLIPALHIGEVEGGEVEPDVVVLPATDLNAKRLLLVEDSMMIALDAQAMLAEEGLDVEVAGTIADANRLLGVDSFDVAVLDVNLSGETSFGVADRLVTLGLPFVFATGYGESIMMPERFRAVPVVSKPYDGAALRMALGGVQAALAAEPAA
ncbi:HWE histidine kinase domain-containing protein [Lichenibacterium ramalinae]|uniref:histidine kinase n=1 Tax=Lichenibacterium ramalinae TaxID=2316527 RepID=A0A4Q2R939_9HYPH|nr:HWE histidine kinase domain-containing protein [Lichenibacterium ramalinae]RYB02024.1 hybrid sensor histidine kinase/response regulator [Lichenibacterium ramalinae]